MTNAAKKSEEKGDQSLENTQDYLEKLRNTQEKAEKNKEHQGKGSPEAKLPNKQHSKTK